MSMIGWNPERWPTSRPDVVKAAVRANGGRWPKQLTSGVMFYMGERITRVEFEVVAARENKHV